MSRGINKVIIIGNLGSDPDVRFTTNGTCMANLSIATDESYKDKQTGQMVPRTEWHKAVAGGRLAEICRDYLKKGSKVYIEGSLQTRKWQDQSGADRYSTEIRIREMQMLDSQGSGQQGGQNQQPQQSGQYVNQDGSAMSPQQVKANQQAPDDFEDGLNIPF